jgi:hypothetical protein
MQRCSRMRRWRDARDVKGGSTLESYRLRFMRCTVLHLQGFLLNLVLIPMMPATPIHQGRNTLSIAALDSSHLCCMWHHIYHITVHAISCAALLCCRASW